MNILNKYFWVVTKPTEFCEFMDVCFKSDFLRLQAQFKGGLTFEEIEGIYTEEAEATKSAKALIRKRDKEISRKNKTN